jgi:hypothetical protein
VENDGYSSTHEDEGDGRTPGQVRPAEDLPDKDTQETHRQRVA